MKFSETCHVKTSVSIEHNKINFLVTNDYAGLADGVKIYDVTASWCGDSTTSPPIFAFYA